MADLIIVDDAPSLRGMLADYFGAGEHTVRLAADAAELDALLSDAVPELVVLDLSLPGEDGLSIARRLRHAHDLGIVMLTGADEVIDKVAGLEVGADDYVTKPFSLNELAARIEAVLRRRRFNGPDILPFGVFSLDLKQWKLFEPNGREVALFPTEIDLVAAFATNAGKMLSRDDLLRLAPAHGSDPMDRSIDTRITRLRRKLETSGHPADLIQTSRGNGYIYKGGRHA